MTDHRVRRIVDEGVRLFVGVGRFKGQMSVVERCLRLASTMPQVDRRIGDVARRPLVHLQPAILTHQEKLYVCLVGQPMIDSLEPTIEPSQRNPFEVRERRRAKVEQFGQQRFVATAMGPRPDEQPL